MKGEHHKANEESLFKNNTFVIVLVAVTLLAVVGLYLTFKPAPSPDNSTLSIGNSPVLGDKNSPVVIYEFTDFSCPYCEAAEGANQQVEDMLKSRSPNWEAPVPAIKEQYVKTGKVKLVFKYYPGHGAAEAAHAVAMGVHEQNPDLFWAFAEKAFASPNDLMDLKKMEALAVSLGADEGELSQYISSGEYKQQMADDKEMAELNNVKGTPAFFINGGFISGAQSFSEFKKVIDKAL